MNHGRAISGIDNLWALWFADNRSAYNLLCSNTFITVVESAELRHGNDLSDAHRLSRKRTLLTEAQVGSRVMVVAEIARQCSFEVAGVHHNVMVETLPSNRTDESFGVPSDLTRHRTSVA